MQIRYLSDYSIPRPSLDQGNEEQKKKVKDILEDVRRNGDRAVKKYTAMFDQAELDAFLVTDGEVDKAVSEVDEETWNVLHEAAANITAFHERQIQQSWMTTQENGTILGQKVTPLDAVGIYVPGGTAAYPSSVLMNAIPAKVAGVKRVVMVTPPGPDGLVPGGVLAAARLAGVREIYKIGGAQAVAALAYGTETIERVDKITGPGNLYVALAKREVFGVVDIDMIAGPSDITVLADHTAVAREVAADLLSQAEHGELSQANLVTTSKELAEAVSNEVGFQLEDLPRKEMASTAINEHSAIYVAESLDEAVEAVNRIAPEHLEIQMEDAMEVVGKIRHAGAIFVGRYSSEPIGDYFAGPNHTLPTSGTARFSSPLSVEDFVKKSSIIAYSQAAFIENADKVARFARLEGLEAHARAVESRFSNKKYD
ncbi:histidinol dehydrogenase [Jeotgalibacillus proteolyticus]|uniref:Histidinol dehydrogenase n=1 Tax=Jeotgalibacillus proteolyticus TaxID=2082395 RepID=A0A2S5GAY6_9BACL|nr:histidinol dehydrogenase [Jeotgalibacillus proteolyticus]PPA70197.1 histidinol dehydrogenase [Jeotgalibacillus proteolyticus]